MPPVSGKQLMITVLLVTAGWYAGMALSLVVIILALQGAF